MDDSEQGTLKEIEAILLKATKGRKYTYQPIEHPYFKGWKNKNIHIDDKVNAIKEHITGNVAIDFGCSNGYVCRRLKEFLIHPIGVQYNGGYNYKRVQQKLEELGFPKFDFREEKIEHFVKKNPAKYRTCAVIALAIFHWFLKTEKSFKILNEVIAPWIKNNASQLFFEYCHWSGYKDWSIDDWKNFWMTNCGFTSCKEIYSVKTFQKRTILLFEKDFTCYNGDIEYVNPNDIKYHIKDYKKYLGVRMWHVRGGYKGILGMKCGGDWDIDKSLNFETGENLKLKVCNYMVDRFVHKKDWNEIGEREKKRQSSDRLYESMKVNGYIKNANGLGWDEVCVAVGRDGELFLLNARHRVSIARILNIKKIPVRVLLVHSDYKGDLMKGKSLIELEAMGE